MMGNILVLANRTIYIQQILTPVYNAERLIISESFFVAGG